MNLGNLLPRGIFHPPVLSNQVEKFLLDHSQFLALSIVDLERWSNRENFSMNLPQAGPARGFVPELRTKAHELLLHISQKVPTGILDSISVPNCQNLLLDDILSSMERTGP